MRSGRGVHPRDHPARTDRRGVSPRRLPWIVAVGLAASGAACVLMASCNILSPAAYLAFGQSKTPAQYEPQDVTTVVFVDGHHDGAATWDYYRAVLPHLKPGAVIAFDDINWSPGMRRAWNRIRRDGDVGAAVDLLHIGLVLVGGDGTPGQFRLTI